MKIHLFGELLRVEKESKTYFLKKIEVENLRMEDVTGRININGLYMNEMECIKHEELEIENTAARYNFYGSRRTSEDELEIKLQKSREEIKRRYKKLRLSQEGNKYIYSVSFKPLGTTEVNEDIFNGIIRWLSV